MFSSVRILVTVPSLSVIRLRRLEVARSTDIPVDVPVTQLAKIEVLNPRKGTCIGCAVAVQDRLDDHTGLENIVVPKSVNADPY